MEAGERDQTGRDLVKVEHGEAARAEGACEGREIGGLDMIQVLKGRREDLVLILCHPR